MGRGRPPDTFKLGRVCGYFDCRTMLSIYNKDRYCSLHGPLEVQRRLDRRI